MKLILKNTSLKFEKNATKHFIDIDTYTDPETGTVNNKLFFADYMHQDNPSVSYITHINVDEDVNKTMRLYDVSSFAGTTLNVEIDYNISQNWPQDDPRRNPYVIAFLSTSFIPTEYVQSDRISIDEGLITVDNLIDVTKTWESTAFCKISGKIIVPNNAVAMAVRVGDYYGETGESPFNCKVYYSE